MRKVPALRSIPALTLAAMMLNGCGGGGGAPAHEPTHGVAVEEPAPGTTAPGTTAPGTTAPPLPDMSTMDLGNIDWQFSLGGTELPVTVSAKNGEGTFEDQGTRYKVTVEKEIHYADLDGDGDRDAIAGMQAIALDANFSSQVWYAWLAADPAPVQVEYPLAEMGRCGTTLHSIVAKDGKVSISQAKRIPFVDDAVPCSDPGTGTEQRVIEFQEHGGKLWPVQTAPLLAWGGVCPGSPYPDSPPAPVDLFAGPGNSFPKARSADATGGVFGLYSTPLMEIGDWVLLGFIDGSVDTGPVKLQCAFGPKA